MGDANDFNRRQLGNGSLKEGHITALVEFWQRHHDLAVDGYFGENTKDSVEREMHVDSGRYWPLVMLPDGRKPVITSGFYTENPSRPTHRGVDMFYKWLEQDPDVPVGDGGAIKRRGKRKWWYPPADFCQLAGYAIAAGDGMVKRSGRIATGLRCWIEHQDGTQTGYFHLGTLEVVAGQPVRAGQPLGLVWDSPIGRDAKHLHFEVSPAGKYAPVNPRKWLENAKFFQG